jgi:two-component system NtrC family sensor kinase
MTKAVLIVDDSLTVRMDLDEAFRAGGFDVVTAKDLVSARDAMAARSFDVVVLDVSLPDGDGVDFLCEVKSAQPTLPVMLLSTKDELRDRLQALRVGADEYIGKPYDTQYVVSRATELVGHAPVSESAPLVLVIDDSPTVLEQLAAALTTAGFRVAVAHTGEEGLRIAVERRPSAIIVDGVLPGIDGLTVVRRVRSDPALRRTPCLLLTGSGTIDELGALDAGADAFVSKNDDIGVVLARLRAILRSPRSPAAYSAPSLLSPKKILAVDDSETYLQAVASQLREEGYRVVLGRSGAEALELLEVETVDCILLDRIMPGLSGEETCRLIRATPKLRDIPLIILTARDDRAAMIEGINAGADDYIPKASDWDVLKARLRAQLRRKQFEDENRRIREELLRNELAAAEARAAHDLAETRAALLADLEKKNAELAAANAELEAFSYSVSHDLRAPLRAVDGFSVALVEDFGDRLEGQAREYVDEIRAATRRMGELIDDLLELSRLTRAHMARTEVDLTVLAHGVISRLRAADPNRNVDVVIADGLIAKGDARLLRVALENLLGNAWKFTSKREAGRIEVGSVPVEDGRAFFVRDNGAGFDPDYAGKMFGAFQRLHSSQDFEGTGIGLAIVHRIVRRHGGRIWAEGAVDRGATFFFTL